MKKNIILLLIFLLSFCVSCKKEKNLSELEVFMIDNNISIEEISPYFDYKRFNFYDFFELEKLRTSNNYTYLETINYFYTKNIHTALMADTDLILVNKTFTLDETYIPSLIEIDNYPIKVTKYNMYIKKHVLLKYIDMINDLDLNNLYIYSGYRSFERQVEIYKNAKDHNYVASPGTSEHQTGLVIDVSTITNGLTTSFKDTKEYELISKNCAQYGFIIRYPQNKESITGYYFEPWHLRYVGKASATYIMNNNLTLEEYLFKNIEL